MIRKSKPAPLTNNLVRRICPDCGRVLPRASFKKFPVRGNVKHDRCDDCRAIAQSHYASKTGRAA